MAWRAFTRPQKDKMPITFGRERQLDYVSCEDCPDTKRPIKAENAHFVNEWLDSFGIPVRHVYCRKHFQEWQRKYGGDQLPLPNPCSNTGVTLHETNEYRAAESGDRRWSEDGYLYENGENR